MKFRLNEDEQYGYGEWLSIEEELLESLKRHFKQIISEKEFIIKAIEYTCSKLNKDFDEVDYEDFCKYAPYWYMDTLHVPFLNKDKLMNDKLMNPMTEYLEGNDKIKLSFTNASYGLERDSVYKIK